MLSFFGYRGKSRVKPAPARLILESHTFQPYCQTTNNASLSVHYDRPHSIRLWQNTAGEQLLGHGYVIQPDGTLRPPDAYVPNYQLELQPNGVVVPNVLQTFTEYFYHSSQPKELQGLMAWDHLQRSELVLVWFQTCPDSEPQYEIVYWPPEITVAQHAAALQITCGLLEHFPQLSALTPFPATYQPTPWRLHDGERNAVDLCRVYLPWLQQLARLAHGQLDLDESANRFIYHREPTLPGLSVMSFGCANAIPRLLEAQLTTDLAWRLAALEYATPNSHPRTET